jgi:hypothetical protein
MMTPPVTTSHQIPQEDTIEPLIWTVEDETDDEDDHESDDDESVIPATIHRTPHAAEESPPVHYLPPDAQTLIHEWFTERDIPWIQKSDDKQAAEISHALPNSTHQPPWRGLVEFLAS